MSSPIINILTYKLPYELSNKIYNEYQSRKREVEYILEKYEAFFLLKEDEEIIELLLALSVFYKRIISNLDAATKFYGKVTSNSDASAVQIGNYKLTQSETNKLYSVIISYNQLLEKYSIPNSLMEYNETIELLKNIKQLKFDLNGRSQEDEDLPL